jgi:hypothetical protein
MLFTKANLDGNRDAILTVIKCQLESIERLEERLLKIETDRALKIQQALKNHEDHLHQACHLLDVDINYMVEQQAVEINVQLVNNRKDVYNFTAQLRIGRNAQQKQWIDNLEHLKRDVWVPNRTQYLLDRFREAMETLEKNEESLTLKRFQQRQSEIFQMQLEAIEKLLNVEPMQLQLEAIEQASNLVQTVAKREFDLLFDKTYRDLRNADATILPLKSEKVEQLKPLLMECHGRIPRDGQAVIDACFDQKRTNEMATIQKRAVDVLKAETKRNKDVLLSICDYLRQLVTIWKTHRDMLEKLPETLQKHLEEVDQSYGADENRIEQRLEKILFQMKYDDESLQSLQSHLSKAKSIMTEMQELYVVIYGEQSHRQIQVDAPKVGWRYECASRFGARAYPRLPQGSRHIFRRRRT